MPKVKSGDTVKVHYTGKLEDGRVFDTSREREPLEFEVGANTIIPGFEEAIIDMEPGETKDVEVSSEKGYGQRRDDMIVTVERHEIPENIDPQVGQVLQIQPKDAQPINVVVLESDEKAVTLDANHPLAGKDLFFEIELLEIT